MKKSLWWHWFCADCGEHQVYANATSAYARAGRHYLYGRRLGAFRPCAPALTAVHVIRTDLEPSRVRDYCPVCASAR